MKKLFLLLIAITTMQLTQAQQTVDAIRKQATQLAQQQQFNEAVALLQQGLQQYPNNIDILKDEAFISYLGRDYQNALKVAKPLVERDDADVQSYQILGLIYKALAEYKDADKLYKSGLKKFPESGVLYSEYGDMLTQYDNKRGAIEQWEKGIAAAPAYSSNYYYAAKYYADANNLLWSTVYSEIFVNTESLSNRTTEIKTLLVNNYKIIFSGKSNLEGLKTNGTDFEKAVATAMLNAVEPETGAVTPDMVTAFLTRFTLNWNNGDAVNYPYHLFGYYTQLLRDGLFDAYNQWLFGPIINKNKYDNWVYTHDAEVLDFTQFQHNVLFKMPAEQYYGHRN